MNINEWINQQHEDNQGKIVVACIMTQVPHQSEDVRRYQIYNEEETINKLVDVTLDSEQEIINIEEY